MDYIYKIRSVLKLNRTSNQTKFIVPLFLPVPGFWDSRCIRAKIREWKDDRGLF